MGCVSSKDSVLDVEVEAPEWDGHVRSIRAWKIEPALTSAHLTRLRNEFWETRVEGRAEMWQALRFAIEAESDELRDETINAAGLRPANRRFTLLSSFDERGALYEVPMYALTAPTNLDGTPSHVEFKDAARAVTEFAEAGDRNRHTSRHHLHTHAHAHAHAHTHGHGHGHSHPHLH